MSNVDLEFPKPVRMNNRLYWCRSELEAYKRTLIRHATGATREPEPVRNEIETFVTAEQVTKEFGFGRRTLGRRIAGRSVTEAA